MKKAKSIGRNYTVTQYTAKNKSGYNILSGFFMTGNNKVTKKYPSVKSSKTKIVSKNKALNIKFKKSKMFFGKWNF